MEGGGAFFLFFFLLVEIFRVSLPPPPSPTLKKMLRACKGYIGLCTPIKLLIFGLG